MDNKPALKVRCLGQVSRLNLWGSNHIDRTAEERVNFVTGRLCHVLALG